jgi:hypothetical protein
VPPLVSLATSVPTALWGNGALRPASPSPTSSASASAPLVSMPAAPLAFLQMNSAQSAMRGSTHPRWGMRAKSNASGPAAPANTPTRPVSPAKISAFRARLVVPTLLRQAARQSAPSAREAWCQTQRTLDRALLLQQKRAMQEKKAQMILRAYRVPKVVSGRPSKVQAYHARTVGLVTLLRMKNRRNATHV